MKVRIKFTKHGAMKFLGHLDVMRYFQKAMRRAGIDIAYSTGFSPHQIMSFAAPLGVGLESDGEYMDIQLNSHRGANQLVADLNGAMAEGITVLSAKALPEGAGNAMATVAAAAYDVDFREGYAPDFDWISEFAAFMKSETILYTKETKKGQREIDLKAAVFSFAIKEKTMQFTVDASSAGNIKPGMLLEAFYQSKGLELSPFALLICRKETYMNDEKSEGKLVPLDAIGEAF